MKKLFCILILIFISSKSIFSVYDFRFIKNQKIINKIEKKVKKSKKLLPYIINYYNIAFILDKKNKKIDIFFPFFSYNLYQFIGKVKSSIKIKDDNLCNYDDIFKFISSKEIKSENIESNFEILDLEFLEPGNSLLYSSLEYIKKFLCFDFEKGSRVFYTVPSEDKLDDVHMVYESGKEKKEFKFTNSPEMPIVPVEEANKINQENIKPKKNFFRFPGFISKFLKKNNNDFLDEEQKKLKVD